MKLKLIDQGIITGEEIQSSNCPVCNSVLTFTRNETDEWFTTHCNRDIILICVKYQCTIKKNSNVVINKERKHLPHPDPVIKKRR